MFLRDLTEHATQREFVYSHSWGPYDLVMWDNRTTMHRARRFDPTKCATCAAPPWPATPRPWNRSHERFGAAAEGTVDVGLMTIFAS